MYKKLYIGRKNPKLRYSTLSNSSVESALKDVDVFTKVISLQCFWIKRLYDENFHTWKIFHLYLIKTNVFENFKSRPCLEPNQATEKRTERL